MVGMVLSFVTERANKMELVASYEIFKETEDNGEEFFTLVCNGATEGIYETYEDAKKVLQSIVRDS